MHMYMYMCVLGCVCRGCGMSCRGAPARSCAGSSRRAPTCTHPVNALPLAGALVHAAGEAFRHELARQKTLLLYRGDALLCTLLRLHGRRDSCVHEYVRLRAVVRAAVVTVPVGVRRQGCDSGSGGSGGGGSGGGGSGGGGSGGGGPGLRRGSRDGSMLVPDPSPKVG
jgi:uncharacterized membrane protein YgcG